MISQYDKLNRINDELLSKQRQSMKSSEAENRKLMRELLTAQEDLQRKEDALRQLERDLNAIPGVVDNGLFVGLAGRVLVAHNDGSVETL